MMPGYFLLIFFRVALICCSSPPEKQDLTKEPMTLTNLKLDKLILGESDFGLMMLENENVITSLTQIILESLPTSLDVTDPRIKHINAASIVTKLQERLGKAIQYELNSYPYSFDAELLKEKIFSQLSQTFDEVLGRRFVLLEKMQNTEGQQKLEVLGPKLRAVIKYILKEHPDYISDEFSNTIIIGVTEIVDDVIKQVINYPVVSQEIKRAVLLEDVNDDDDYKTEQILQALSPFLLEGFQKGIEEKRLTISSSCWEDTLVDKLYKVMNQGLQEGLWLASQLIPVLKKEANKQILSNSVRSKTMKSLRTALYNEIFEFKAEYAEYFDTNAKSEDILKVVKYPLKVKVLAAFYKLEGESLADYIWNTLKQEVQSTSQVNVTIPRITPLYETVNKKIQWEINTIGMGDMLDQCRKEIYSNPSV